MRPLDSRAALCWALAAALLATGLEAAGRQRPEYNKKYFEPTEEVVTPHIAWAKPLAGGPLRALFITHRAAMREVVELAERLDLDYTVFVTETKAKFGATGKGVDASWRLIKGNSAEELADNLRNKLQADYDLIVVGDFKWDELPIDCRYFILKKVKEGAGLVGYIPRGRGEYLGRIIARNAFVWRFGRWSGGAKGIADFFGKGVFEEAADSAVAHSGSRSARIVCKSAERGSRESPRGAFHSKPIGLEPGATYRFSVWYRTKDMPVGGATAGVLPLGSFALKPSEQWRQATYSFTNKRAAKRGTIYLWSYKPGTVWFDDVSLVKVGEEAKNLAPNPSFENGPRDEDVEPLTAGMPLGMLPAFKRAKANADALRSYCETSRFGKGRVLLFKGFGVGGFQMLTPRAQGDPLDVNTLDYDYYLGFAIRAMLWAAQREAPVSVAASVSEQPRDALAAEFQLRASSAEPAAALALVVRAHDGRIVHKVERTVALAAGESSEVFKLPKLPAGDYFADLWVRRGKAVLGWGSAGLRVTAPATIDEIALAQPSFKRAEPVGGTVALTGVQAGDALVVTQVDNFGRELAEQRVALTAGQAEAAFQLNGGLGALTLVQAVDARLLRGQDALDFKRKRFGTRDLYPDREDVRFVMWQGFPGNSFISPLMAREFYKHGIDTQYTGFSKWAFCENLWHLPYAIRFVDKKTDWYQPRRTRTKDDLVRSPCLTDPKYLAQVRGRLTKRTEQAAAFSTNDISLGDECHFVAGRYDLCFSPTCIADFRKFVKAEYGDLGKLNAEYGTSYKSWNEVAPITFEQAKKRGRFAQWVDHRRHMESVWASIYSFSRDVIREVVPDARVGYEGSDTRINSYRAADFWKLARVMNLNNIYFRDFLVDMIRDFSDPGTLFGGGWYGGYASNRNDAHMRWFPWMTLFRGGNSFWVWMGYGNAGSVMAPDLSMYPFFKANVEEVREIKAGVGKLLMLAHREDDRTAILYSPSSVHANTITNELPKIESTLMGLARALSDVGLQYRVISTEQVKAGALNRDRFDVVWLPECQALSASEAKAVREFVEQGGCAIADLRPAVMNEHCTPQPAGQLDDVFGVKQSPTKLDANSGDVRVTKSAKGFEFTGELPPSVGDASIQLAGAEAAGQVGDAPAVMVHGFGRGKTVLLNFTLAGYIEREKAVTLEADFARWPVNAPVRAFVARVMAYAGVDAPVATVPALPRLLVARLACGDAHYVGVLQGLPRPNTDYTLRKATLPPAQSVKLRLGRAGHVYDVRAKAYLGHSPTIDVAIQPTRAKLYAILPYKVESLDVGAPKQVAQGQAITCRLGIECAAGKPGLHVARVVLRNPDGKVVDYYSRNVKMADGAAEITWRLARNEAVGNWTIRAQDVATGVAGEATFAVHAK